MTLTLLLFLSWLCLSPTSSAFDITNILGHHPELSTFSNYLTQTQLTHDINSRQSITLLAIANSDMGPLSGKPMEQIEKIMAVHVLLGYYDLAKFKKLQGSTLTVPTLLRSNSINITVARGGIVAFGSTRSQLVRTVESDPYTISVLQINSPIMPCGGLLAPRRRSRRALAESPAQSPSQNNQDKHASPPQASHPPSDSHSNHSDLAPSPQQQHNNGAPPPQQQHDNGAPPPSNSDDNNKNAPQPSDDNNSSSSPPLSAENNNSSPSPSSDDSSSPSSDSPSSSDSPQDDNADSPDSDDDDEKKKDSPPSSAPPKGDDSPSSGPSSDSPSSAPTDDDTPNSEDDDNKRKNSAGGISPSSTGWIGVIAISVILGKMV